MAPRPLETFDQFRNRLLSAMAAGDSEVRFGGSHYTHAVCHEGEAWVVRKLELSAEQIEAMWVKRPFTPEQFEDSLQLGTAEFAASTLEAILAHLVTRWQDGTLHPIDNTYQN